MYTIPNTGVPYVHNTKYRCPICTSYQIQVSHMNFIQNTGVPYVLHTKYRCSIICTLYPIQVSNMSTYQIQTKRPPNNHLFIKTIFCLSYCRPLLTALTVYSKYSYMYTIYTKIQEHHMEQQIKSNKNELWSKYRCTIIRGVRVKKVTQKSKCFFT